MVQSNLKIGNVSLESNVFLAPMAGVTDLPFRLICKEYGAGLLYTEMINAKALSYGDENTNKMLKLEEAEKPVAVQIFGSEPYFLARAAEILNDHDFVILDINMGCPAPKVVKNGDGSALMKNPDLAAQIVREVVKVSKNPVTVKIRKGWDETSVNAIDFAKKMEEAGATALTIHGRTREQYYSGKADWDIIRKIKKELTIPVIGNGDVFSAEDAKRMLEETNVDGIMIGRGSQGNPFIFREIKEFEKTGQLPEAASAIEKIETALKHFKIAIEEKGEYSGVREMRKHLGWYFKGIRNNAKMKDEINRITDSKVVENKLLEYLETLTSTDK